MFLSLLKSLNQILLADESSSEILAQYDVHNTTVCGDTRIDRVIQIAEKHRDFTFLHDVLQSNKLLVAGSTWPEDIKLMLPMINSGKLKCVIAPHENGENKLKELEQLITVKTLRFSQLSKSTSDRASIVIVDTMGDLAEIYHVANVAYVGGGFTSGIHSILEAVTYRLPVIFGPDYKRFGEAVELISLGVCKSIKSAAEFQNALSFYSIESNREAVIAIAGQYLDRHSGATTRIYDYIRRERLLK
jgi:3-deoxy-D-manno-octulosonic-acid transferase